MSTKPALSQPQFPDFAHFWEHYVNQHKHPLNQIMHAAGTIGGVICLGLAVCLSWWWLMLVLPIGYGAAFLGHYLVERNRPLTFTYPLWSLRADYRLVGRLLTLRRLSDIKTDDAIESRQAA